MTESPTRFPASAKHSGSENNAYITEAQFCKKYHVAPRTAQRWRVTGDGPPFVRLGPHKIVYRVSDTEAWAAARTFTHRADELSRTKP
jgi:hypothetical protein